MIKLAKCAAVLVLFLPAAGCMQTVAYRPSDFFGAYTQRTDKVSLSAGDDQEVNTRLQEIDPWPRHAWNTNIETDGQRMANAVKRYRAGAAKPLPVNASTGGGK